MKIIEISPDEVIALRHLELRPHQDISKSRYNGDFLSTSFHLGFKKSHEILAIGSFFLESNNDFPHKLQYRIRGMVTQKEFRNQGFGSAIIEKSEQIIKNRYKGTLIWCNARSSAIAFYHKNGFKKQGNKFNLPPIGPHYVMFKNIHPNNTKK